MNSSESNPVDLYFADARSKLIDLAAFMDRVERAGQTDDYRYLAFTKALESLQGPEKAVSVLQSFSDPTTDPIEAATAPATGAWNNTV